MNTTSTIQAIDAKIMPWFFNKADNPDSNVLWIQYNHFTCYMIEEFYQRYKDGDDSYRQIPIPGGYVIDLFFMI